MQSRACRKPATKGCCCCCVKSLQSCPTHQAPLSMGFSRQEPWRGFPWPPPGGLPDSGMKPMFLTSSCTGRRVLYHQHHLGGLAIERNWQKCQSAERRLCADMPGRSGRLCPDTDHPPAATPQTQGRGLGSGSQSPGGRCAESGLARCVQVGPVLMGTRWSLLLSYLVKILLSSHVTVFSGCPCPAQIRVFISASPTLSVFVSWSAKSRAGREKPEVSRKQLRWIRRNAGGRQMERGSRKVWEAEPTKC